MYPYSGIFVIMRLAVDYIRHGIMEEGRWRSISQGLERPVMRLGAMTPWGWGYRDPALKSHIELQFHPRSKILTTNAVCSRHNTSFNKERCSRADCRLNRHRILCMQLTICSLLPDAHQAAVPSWRDSLAGPARVSRTVSVAGIL